MSREKADSRTDLTALPALTRTFYERDSRDVAVDLLNKVLVLDEPAGGVVAARIVETEAYLGALDPASHTFRGETARNATMFGAAGHLYVYFSYGMHWCANAVCGRTGEGTAVLLRAAAPIEGLDQMFQRRRAARRDRDLCSGPAKLCQAFGIDRALDGADLVDVLDLEIPRVRIVDDGTPPPVDAVQTPRIGISVAVEEPWRWYVPGDPNVSRP